MRGLGLGDFTVEVNGKVQNLLAVAEVDAENSTPVSGAAWTSEAGRDAVTNQRVDGRLFVILLDDAMTPGDPYMGKMTRDVANRVAVGVLRRTASFLADLPGQKSIIFVSTGPTGCPPNGIRESELGFRYTERAHSMVKRVLSELQSSPVPIFSISPAGLRGVGRMGPLVGQAWRGTAALEAVARLSGGHIVANDNAPATHVPALIEEMSSYYAIAYEPSFPLDGALRRLRIKVSRPDVEVLPGQLVLETPNDRLPARRVAPVSSRHWPARYRTATCRWD